MEVIAEFTTRIVNRYQFTLPLTVRKLLAAKGKSVQVGDPVIVQIMEVVKTGEGLELENGSEDRAKKRKKDDGGDSARSPGKRQKSCNMHTGV